MEPEPSAQPARKVKFAPKAPSRRVPKIEPKTEPDLIVDDSITKDLLQRIKENAGRGRGRPKDENKLGYTEVVFGQGNSNKLQYGFRKSSTSRLPPGGSDVSGVRDVKDYIQPWANHSYPPITVPLREDSGINPVLLDEEEFGEGLENSTYDENSLNAAEELGLMVNNEEERMILLQLPASLPSVKRSVATDNLKLSEGAKRPERGCSLKEMPPGFMGKLLVYKSGLVKLKLGETLYDVNPGSECVFTQDVVAVNTEKKHCCTVKGLEQRAIVTPDMDSLMDAFADME